MFKSKNIILSCVFLVTALLLSGCSNDWVEVGGTKDYIIYYKPSSVKIDKYNKTIEVLTKYVYTKEGIISAKEMFGPYIQNKDYFDKFSYSLDLYLFNYKDWKYAIIQNIVYSKSDGILFNKENPPEWEKIVNTNISLILINTLIREYKIKM